MTFVTMNNIYGKKYVSMIRKHHNHTLPTNLRHPEEEPYNINSNNTSGKQSV